MFFDKVLMAGMVMIGIGLSGCEGSVVVENPANGSGGLGGFGGSTTSTTSTGAGGGLPEGFCAQACTKTAESGCLSTAACNEYCGENSPQWTADVGAAFALCAAENPLCFESIEGCLLSQLHPPGSIHTVRLAGSGFDMYNGKVLRAWHDPGTGVPFGGEAVITAGAFAFTWNAPFQATDTVGSVLLLLYIDMDADGTCKASADITASILPEWNKDLINPQYDAVVTPPLSDPDFVCDFPP